MLAQLKIAFLMGLENPVGGNCHFRFWLIQTTQKAGELVGIYSPSGHKEKMHVCVFSTCHRLQNAVTDVTAHSQS